MDAGISEISSDLFAPYISDACQRFEIDTLSRVSFFLAQMFHETGGLRWMRELGSGNAYNGRADLGNTEPGDGPKFKGRGGFMITGRTNYHLCSQALFGDDRLLETPDLLSTPSYAMLSAAWYWNTKDLNATADADDFLLCTRKINGGVIGLADREVWLKKVQQSFENT